MRLLGALTAGAALLAGSASAAKRNVFVYLNVYWQVQANPRDVCKQVNIMADAGISHIVMTFAMGNGAGGKDLVDAALYWSQLTDAEQKACKQQVNDKGTKLILSFGGEYDKQHPWLSQTADSYAKAVVDLVKQQNYDGMDFDLEGIQTLSQKATRDWFVDVSIATRKYFDDAGMTDALIFHAPQAPYFGKTYAGPEGGFVDIAKRAGDAVDFYLIQYYNQGACEYVSYERHFTAGNNCFSPDDYWKAITDHIADPAIAKKLVIGKLANREDSSSGNGYVPSDSLGEWLCKAEKELGYDAGIMFWSWREPNDMVSIINNVAGESCNPNSEPEPENPEPENPNPTSSTTKAPTAPTSSTTKAPTEPTTTTTRAPLPPGDYGCYQNKKGAWFPPCESDDVCILNSMDESACHVEDLAEAPFKVWATSVYDCRMSTFHGSFCSGLPEDPAPWTEVPAGGKGCFVSNTWWDSDCGSSNHCQLDGGLKTEENCLSSGKPNAVWAETQQACRQAISGTACSA